MGNCMYYIMCIGTNHGIEIFEDNIEFAEERLKEFKEESPWLVEILIHSLTNVLFSPFLPPFSLPPSLPILLNHYFPLPSPTGMIQLIFVSRIS